MKQTYSLDDFKTGLKDRKRSLRRQASGQMLAKHGKRHGFHESTKRSWLREEAMEQDAKEEMNGED